MTARGHRVFVIDDDHSVCRGLARLLDAAGFRVETFESGAAFLSRSPPKGEHCLVVDVRMPFMTGPELLDTLRAQGRDSPVIFITAHEIELIEHEIGQTPVLHKPIEGDLLVRAIDNAIASLDRRPTRRARGGRR
ncbi:MAG TPA: response regulator [Myxococcales bacterium]|jgi:FixJ family two-component response regulator|nr:response regulator [Myxococcales bacterium]